jgi:adenine-specific DNA-methyltransferase
MENLTPKSTDLTQQNINKLAELFPNVVTETKNEDGVRLGIDFDLLRQELSDHVVEGPQERYRLEWPGKRQAVLSANEQNETTLRPDRQESLCFEDTDNLFIEGENLEVLRLLKESYLGRIDLIYIDPPYNTGADLIYRDDYSQTKQEHLAHTGQISPEGHRLTTNTKANGRFHSDWLSMLYPRLVVARLLLASTGMIFISIGDEEVAQLRLICDEVFGPENFTAMLTVEMSTTQGMKVRAAQRGRIVKNCEYILIYSRTGKHNDIPKTPLYDSVTGWPGNFDTWLHEDLTFEPLANVLNSTPHLVAEAARLTGKPKISLADMSTLTHCSEVFRDFVASNLMSIVASDKGTWPGGLPEPDWVSGQAYEVSTEERSYIVMKSSKNTIRQFLRLSDNYRVSDDYSSSFGRTVIRGDLWKGFYSDMAHVSLEGDTKFANGKKPVRLLMNLFRWANNTKDAVVMDFFGGSGTTAEAVMRMNALDGGSRSFILIQYPEKMSGKSVGSSDLPTVSSLCRERIRRSGAILKQDLEGESSDVDVGFRSFFTDTDSFVEVERTPDATRQEQIPDLVDNLARERTSEDILFALLLRYGLELNLPISFLEVESGSAFNVDNGALIACFEETIDLELVRYIARRSPLRVVFRDSGFQSDTDRINAEQLFKELSPATDVKVI